MKREKAKATYVFHRFIHGIFQYYHDKGMPLETAKARMFKEVYDTCLDFAKREEGIPDHLLVLTMQFVSKFLNHRGFVLSKKLKETNSNDEQAITRLRAALRDLKQVKDAIDHFIETYRGDTQNDQQ
ncbi:hypothetical protein [Parageobacillus galactosidasius]|uniref:Uncharacterized protein n=1 Tax=Parageobacillus galactosidasius TaxID=883812 RepID=A0A226QQN0_9BACL|nr:hypothetical protein [Parageobacillus galactosidasius]OXB94846.1 hypothetical protein B9L23_08265 [Parageobacillus galactosidasius]